MTTDLPFSGWRWQDPAFEFNAYNVSLLRWVARSKDVSQIQYPEPSLLPSVRHYAEVGVADTTVGQSHEHLSRSWLRSIEFDDFRRDLAWLVVDAGLVLGWDGLSVGLA